jgi:hypothetical protein
MNSNVKVLERKPNKHLVFEKIVPMPSNKLSTLFQSYWSTHIVCCILATNINHPCAWQQIFNYSPVVTERGSDPHQHIARGRIIFSGLTRSACAATREFAALISAL